MEPIETPFDQELNIALSFGTLHYQRWQIHVVSMTQRWFVRFESNLTHPTCNTSNDSPYQEAYHVQARTQNGGNFKLHLATHCNIIWSRVEQIALSFCTLHYQRWQIHVVSMTQRWFVWFESNLERLYMNTSNGNHSQGAYHL